MLAILREITATAPWLIPLWGAILGGVLGSFLACMIHRRQTGENLRTPPSKCNACQRRLTTTDLIPVFSYLLLRGKCRTCHAKINPQTFWLELACSLIFTALFFCITLTF